MRGDRASRPHGSSPQGVPNLFALVIGINRYVKGEYETLEGCVADADAVESFLTRKLHVDPLHIISLRDAQATKSEIMKAFRSLQFDQRIQRGNPILIYFAGHGGEALPPLGWPCPSRKVQMLIPHDYGVSTGNGKFIEGIPDYILGSYLNHLSESKGNNIVVILDNCYSGTGTRAFGAPETYGKGIRALKFTGHRLSQDELPQAPPPTSRNNERGITTAFNSNGKRSHTLLAACMSNEYAREAHKRGVFTVALLKTLANVNITRTTYKGLLKMLPHLSSNQNPQCDGLNQDCILFSTRILEPAQSGNSLELKYPILFVHVPDTLPLVTAAVTRLDGVALAPNPESSQISVVQTLNFRIAFSIHDNDVNQYGLDWLPHMVSHGADFYKIFYGMSRYEHHLRRVKGPDESDALTGGVSLEFLKIKRAAQSNGNDFLDGTDLSDNGRRIDLVQDGSWYVIKLTNNTSKDLYPSLFYFDNCDYSINSLYEPPSSNQTSDHPLKACQSIIIGYGDEGFSPFVLDVCIRNPYPAEVGYLKLFISTNYTDYSHIRQDSPFKEVCSQNQAQDTRGFKFYTGPKREYFGSVMVPLIVRAPTTTREIGGPSQSTRSTAQTHSSVFKRRSIPDYHGNKNRIQDFFRKLGHCTQSSTLPEDNIDRDDALFREVQEMGRIIEELKEGVSDLQKEHGQSLNELNELSRRMRRIEKDVGSHSYGT